MIAILVVAISIITGASSTGAERGLSPPERFKRMRPHQDLEVLKYEQIERLDHDLMELKKDISKAQRAIKND